MGRDRRRSQSSWRFRALTVVIVVGAVALTLAAGFTNAFGTGDRFHASVGDMPDGAAGDTFWDGPIVDVPGLSLYSVHCHGKVHYDFQYGSTGPPSGNACYASLGVYENGSGDLETYMLLPGGSQALYRCSTNHGRWVYFIDHVIYAPAPSAPESFPPLEISAVLKGHCEVPY
jgi:hypothetical protein